MDLVTLLSDNGIVLRKKASTHGGEYAGPCPFCAGSDRFRVWPRKGERGRWWCRQCDRAGDDIDLLREWKGMSYKEACEALGVDAKPLVPRNMRASNPEPAKDEPDLAVYKDPPEQWKEQAGLLLKHAVDSLWSDQGDLTVNGCGMRGACSSTRSTRPALESSWRTCTLTARPGGFPLQ